MIGIIVNIICVIVGGLIGGACAKFISQDIVKKLNSVFGICAIGMGIMSVVLMKNMPAVIFALIIGTLLGSVIHLGDLISAGGRQLQKPVSKFLTSKNMTDEEKKDFDSLMVTTMVLFCCSATGIYGCLDAGMTGNTTLLLSKSILDFFTAIIFACSLGYAITLIAVPQTILFFAFFFLARVVVPLTDSVMIADFKACGGMILVATGLRIAKIKDFSIADMIPAMIIVMPCSWIWSQYIAPLL